MRASREKMSHMFDRTSGSLDFFAVLAKLRPQSFFSRTAEEVVIKANETHPGGQ